MTKKTVKLVALIEVFVQGLLSFVYSIATVGEPLGAVVSGVLTIGLCMILFAILNKALKNNKKSIALGVVYIILAGKVGGICYLVWMNKGIDANEAEIEEAKKQNGEEGHQKVAAYCPYCGAPINTPGHCDICGKDF